MPPRFFLSAVVVAPVGGERTLRPAAMVRASTGRRTTGEPTPDG